MARNKDKLRTVLARMYRALGDDDYAALRSRLLRVVFMLTAMMRR